MTITNTKRGRAVQSGRWSLAFKIFGAVAVIAISLSIHPISLAAIDLEQRLELTDAVTTGQLDNGLTYYIQQNQNPRGVIDLRLVVRVGSVYEDEYQRGLAHFVEHMGFNGTELYPGNQIISELELLGAKFGPDLNAYTSFDQTVYTLQLTSGNHKTLEKGLQILQQWGFAMELDRTELRKERAVVLEEERIRRSARQRIADQHFNALLTGTRYRDRLPIGRTEVVRGASAKDIRAFYRRWYRPERMAVIAIGDIESNAVLEMLERIFGAAAQAPPSTTATSDGAPPPTPTEQQGRGDNAIAAALREYQAHDEPQISIAYDPEVTEERAILYLKRPPVDDDTVAAYSESIELALISFILEQRFFDLSEQADSPLDSARLSSGFHRLNHALEIKALLISFADERGEEAIELVLAEIGQVAQAGVSEQEYQNAVRQLRRLYEQYRAEEPTRNSEFYSRAYTDHFLYGELLLDTEEEVALANELIDTIDPAGLKQYAQDLLGADNRFFSYTGIGEPSASAPAPAPDFGGKDAKDNAMTTAKITSEQIIALLTAAEEGKLVSTRQYSEENEREPLFIIESSQLLPQQHTAYSYDENIELHRWEYANGITVVLRENDYSQDTVNFNLYSRGGSSLYDDDEYIDASNAAAIATVGGVAELTPSELRRYLSDKQVAVLPYVRQFTQGMSGSFSVADRGVFGELLYAYFVAPRFDEVQAENWRRRAIEQIAERNNNPITQLALRQQELLTNGNLRTVPLTVPQAEGIDARNAYRIYGERFAESGAGNFTLIVTGNISAEQLQSDVLERYIANLPVSPQEQQDADADEQWRLYSIDYPTRPISEELYAGVSERGIATMLYFGEYQWGLQENNTLFALADYLDLLLNERIREENSSVYSVSAGANPMRLPSDRFILQLYFGSDPEQMPAIITHLEEIIETVRTTPPSSEELARIKETQRSQFLRDSQTNGYWVGLLRLSDLYGFSVTEARDRLSRIEALTANDIQQLAARYLSNERLITLTLEPENAAP